MNWDSLWSTQTRSFHCNSLDFYGIIKQWYICQTPRLFQPRLSKDLDLQVSRSSPNQKTSSRTWRQCLVLLHKVHPGRTWLTTLDSWCGPFDGPQWTFKRTKTHMKSPHGSAAEKRRALPFFLQHPEKWSTALTDIHQRKSQPVYWETINHSSL